MSAKQRPMARTTPHTAPATYHYIAAYTLQLLPQMLWPVEGNRASRGGLDRAIVPAYTFA